MTPKPRTRPPSATEISEIGFASIPLAQLSPNAYNARRFEDMTPQRQARFAELVASVDAHGILEPLLVRPIACGRFEIIAGERRYRAALEVAAGSRGYEVPCMVRDVGDDEAFDLMLIENLHRDDLSPFETAQAFQVYLDRHGNTHDAAADLSARTGVPVHGIRRMVRLLHLPESVLDAWKAGSLTQSHAELFTRLADDAQVTELLSSCLRLKLSTRELAERIGAIVPELAKGFFEKEDCQTCGCNSSVQSGLFADSSQEGRCGDPACFERKQGEFLSGNWPRSKAAEKFGTRGFRFSHRLEQDHRSLLSETTSERCRSCDTFVSVLRLTGVVVGGYERVCVGPRICYEEMYLQLPLSAAESAAASDCGHNRPECPTDNSICPDCLDAGPATHDKDGNPITAGPETYTEPSDLGAHLAAAREGRKLPGESETVPPSKTSGRLEMHEETGPVFDAARGDRARQEFIKEKLPEVVNGFPAGPLSPVCLRMVLVALALASSAVKTRLIAGMGLNSNIKPDQLAAKIFEIPAGGAASEVVSAALAHILNDFTLMPAVRVLVAEKFGLDLSREWRLNERYLQGLTKSEIVRIGEEPGVGLWKDEKVEAWRNKHHKGKALMSLRKDELIDVILMGGADLAGRVPAEVLGKAPKR